MYCYIVKEMLATTDREQLWDWKLDLKVQRETLIIVSHEQLKNKGQEPIMLTPIEQFSNDCRK